MAQVAVNGASLWCEEAGSGDPPFVFIHGWCCDAQDWRFQRDDLSSMHRCLVLELRGCGRSPATPPYDMTQAADDVAAVMRELGFGPSIIAGHALGGMAALLLNDRHPDLVCGVVVVDTPIGPLAAGRAEATRKLVEEAGSMENARDLLESYLAEGSPPETRDYLFDVLAKAPLDVAVGMLSNDEVYLKRTNELLKAADKKPFMAIWAGTPRTDLEWMRERTFFLRQERVPGTGHFVQLDKPAVVTALLRAFVDDVERDPRLAKRG